MAVRGRITMAVGLILFIVGVWLLLNSIAAWLLALPSATSVALIGFVGIVLVPIITWFANRSVQRNRARDDAIREKRTEFYDKAIRGILRNLNIDETAEPVTPEEQGKFIADLTPDFVLYASRGVVLAWNQFRAIGQQDKPSNIAMLFAFEGVLRAMRKDLGHAISPQPNLELLKMFITDIDSLEPERRRRQRPKAG